MGKSILRLNFGLILVCFMLPFITISCNNNKIASLNGYELAFGTTLESNQSSSRNKQKQETEPQPFAIIAIFFGVTGLITSLSNGSNVFRYCSVSGLCGIISMAVLYLQIIEDNSKNKLISIEIEYGFWLVGFLFCSVLILPSILNKYSN